jgi:hypothetical protein
LPRLLEISLTVPSALTVESVPAEGPVAAARKRVAAGAGEVEAEGEGDVDADATGVGVAFFSSPDRTMKMATAAATTATTRTPRTTNRAGPRLLPGGPPVEAAGAGWGGAAGLAGDNAAPHSVQKRASSSLTPPHAWQALAMVHLRV